MTDLSSTLSTARKKRIVSPGVTPADALQHFTMLDSHPLHKTTQVLHRLSPAALHHALLRHMACLLRIRLPALHLYPADVSWASSQDADAAV